MNEFNYMTFKSVSYAMKVETALKKYDFRYKIIPVPRSISSSCGLCIRFYKEDMEKLITIINNNNLQYENIYTDC
ncbi:DUF3343 domain-containing protein [Sedimentibacter hydroxybenzoicus DSM 7310]|uniref:DUF3343 domain-containing protein n=1 Tax=Sedimentibacter hydroxybenzoicus DSM 7310 TaxID=1123245 RepID=A0A974BK19_SEDHY|nr:DUF3343 domain-containing protein [Sedimentibacter hydroxybenzoicus]NYB74614.1 DUF3343 domain-containing protein [Sedimentibacter hydroxybenzoicus DSM 7310]